MSVCIRCKGTGEEPLTLYQLQNELCMRMQCSNTLVDCNKCLFAGDNVEEFKKLLERLEHV